MDFTGERYVPELRGQIYYEHLHRYALALPLAQNKDVLDVASGEGYGAGFLAMVARSVVGVDIDDASVSYSAARYTAMNLKFMKGSAAQIPLADDSVDLVVSFETIEHLVEQEQMLGEIKRVLRDDGHVIISSPNKLVYSDARNYQNPFHVRELYFDQFRDLLRAFFPEVRIFGQRIFAGSAVHPLGGASPESRWLGPSIEAQRGIAALPDPEYFIAVCACRTGSEALNLSSIYLDPRDDLLADVRSGGLAGAQMTQARLEPSRLPPPALSASVTQALSAGNGTIPRESTTLEQLRVELEQERISAAALRSELEQTHTESREAFRSAAETSLILDSFNDEIHELKAASERAVGEAAGLREQLRRQEAQYVSSLTVVSTLGSALSAERAAHEATNQRLSGRLAATKQQLDANLSSTSWRLLTPARKLALKLRSLRSKLRR